MGTQQVGKGARCLGRTWATVSKRRGITGLLAARSFDQAFECLAVVRNRGRVHFVRQDPSVHHPQANEGGINWVRVTSRSSRDRLDLLPGLCGRPPQLLQALVATAFEAVELVP